MSDGIIVEEGVVTTLRLNRPEQRNALNSETIETLINALETYGGAAQVRVIRLTAAGDKAFCAGADLRQVDALQSVEEVRQYFGGMARLMAAMHRCPKPIVAAVFGYTLAGGMGLAAGADLVVAAEDTVFGLPEIQIGLFPMVVMAPIMRHLGQRRTLELAWTGDRIDAKTAERWGFVNRVYPTPNLQRDSVKFCEELSEKSAFIASLGKQAARTAEDLPYEDALRYLQEMVSLVALSDDSREGIRAFWEKRRPRW